MNDVVRFDSLQPNDSANVIRINARGKKKGRQSGTVNSMFLQNKLFGWGAASMKKFN